MSAPFNHVQDAATISTTEYYLFSDSTSATPQTTDAEVDVWIDFSAMTAAEVYDVQPYEKVNGGSMIAAGPPSRLTGVQSSLYRLNLGRVAEGYEVSVKKISGTDRSIAWGLNSDVGDTTVAGYASGQVPLQPTVAGRTLDVTATGAAGVDWGNVENPTTTVGLSGTTVKTATDVETDTADIQTRLPAALTAGGFIKADSLAIDGSTAAATALKNHANNDTDPWDAAGGGGYPVFLIQAPAFLQVPATGSRDHFLSFQIIDTDGSLGPDADADIEIYLFDAQSNDISARLASSPMPPAGVIDGYYSNTIEIQSTDDAELMTPLNLVIAFEVGAVVRNYEFQFPLVAAPADAGSGAYGPPSIEPMQFLDAANFGVTLPRFRFTSPADLFDDGATTNEIVGETGLTESTLNGPGFRMRCCKPGASSFSTIGGVWDELGDGRYEFAPDTESDIWDGTENVAKPGTLHVECNVGSAEAQDWRLIAILPYTSIRKATDKLTTIEGKVDTAQTAISSIQNNTRCVRVVPDQIAVPESSTRTYRIELLLYDENGNMEAPDSPPTIALVNQAGTDRSARLDSTTMALVSAGRYRAIYTSTAGDTEEQLVWAFSVVEGGATRVYGNTSNVGEGGVADVNVVSFDAGAITGDALDVTALEAIADETWGTLLEGSATAADLIRLITGVLAGKVTNFTTGTFAFKSLDGTKTRLTVTVDETGRLTITVGNLT